MRWKITTYTPAPAPDSALDFLVDSMGRDHVFSRILPEEVANSDRHRLTLFANEGLVLDDVSDYSHGQRYRFLESVGSHAEIADRCSDREYVRESVLRVILAYLHQYNDALAIVFNPLFSPSWKWVTNFDPADLVCDEHHGYILVRPERCEFAGNSKELEAFRVFEPVNCICTRSSLERSPDLLVANWAKAARILFTSVFDGEGMLRWSVL